MDFKSDTLHVNTAPVDSVGGAKPEPEERPVDRVLTTNLPLTGTAGWRGNDVGGAVALESTVADAVSATSKMCYQCKHFKRAAWNEVRRRLQTDPILGRQINHLRANLMMDGSEPEEALNQMGACAAYTALFRMNGMSSEEALTIVHPQSHCPETFPPNDDGSANAHTGEALPVMFEYIDTATEKAAVAHSDQILMTATVK